SGVEREYLRKRAVVLAARLDGLTRAQSLAAPTAVSTGPTSATPVPLPREADRQVSFARPRRFPIPEKRPSPAHLEATPAQEEPRHRDDIQGLRAVAVLVVALAHAGVGFLKGGFVGVDVFFVLSGFLITSLLLSEARRRHYVSLAEFYLRRARRILPAATLTLIVTDFAAYHLLNIVRAKQYLQDSIPSALFAANIHFAAQGTDYFARGQPPSPFQHFWSLAVEEQFYVVWPALFVIVLGLSFRRYALRPDTLRHGAVLRVLSVVATIAAASLVWSIYYTPAHPTAAYFSTPARVWELALGAGLAVAASRLTELPAGWRTGMGWSGLACIAIAAVTYSGATPFPGFAALLPTVGAALVIAAGLTMTHPRRSVARVLSIAPLRYVGDRSYAFYLWHWPVLVIAAQYAGHNLSVGTNLLLLAAAFALSIASYRLIENPIRRAELMHKPEAVLVWVPSIVAVLVLAASYVSSINDREARQSLAAAKTSTQVLSVAPAAAPVTARPQRVGGAPPTPTAPAISPALPAVIKAVNSASRSRGVPASVAPPVAQLLNDYARIPAACEAHDGQATATLCRLGASSGSKTIAVIGDSHAEMWMPAILSLAHRDGWAVVPIMKSGCGPANWTDSIGTRECHAWFRWAVREDNALHPDVTLIGGFYDHVGSGPDQQTMDGLSASALGVKKGSKRVVILGDVPQRDRQPVDCLLASHASVAGCSDLLTPTELNLESRVSQLAQFDRLGLIDPTGWFCYQGQCPLVVANIIAYRDDNHVSQTYATALSGAFRAAFNAAVRPGKPA
ncbi:MAG: hypothetical protein QOG59_2177, partial [Solirubrobacteraceae bacterium]|nr:hypothetical protein [Solirubrobacteraceae bacterium]